MLRTFAAPSGLAPYVDIRKHEFLTVQFYRSDFIQSVHYSYNHIYQQMHTKYT
jgi:hypothetical protein